MPAAMSSRRFELLFGDSEGAGQPWQGLPS